jgi:hypothetical protein
VIEPPSGFVTLGMVAARLSTIEVSCTRCGRHGRLQTKRLLAEHGAAMPMPELLRALAANCPKMAMRSMHDSCGAHFPGLVDLRL